MLSLRSTVLPSIHYPFANSPRCAAEAVLAYPPYWGVAGAGAQTMQNTGKTWAPNPLAYDTVLFLLSLSWKLNIASVSGLVS